MSNTWQYSNLGQRERLKLIRGGNSDVYNAEKKNNQALRNARLSAGLSTDEVDRWDRLIDSANESANDPYKIKDNGQPRFASTRVMKINKEFNDYMDELDRQYELSRTEAVNDAEKSSDYLAELLANNGYSKNGNESRTRQSEIWNELYEKLKELESSYDSKAQKARESYRTELSLAKRR